MNMLRQASMLPTWLLDNKYIFQYRDNPNSRPEIIIFERDNPEIVFKYKPFYQRGDTLFKEEGLHNQGSCNQK